MLRIIGLAIAFIAAPVSADIYKCKEGGKTVYQGTPCKTEGNKLDIKTVKQERSTKEVLADLERYFKEPTGMATKEERENLKVAATKHLKLILKDPDSLKDLGFVLFAETKAGFIVEATYQAKNGFGAYNGYSKTGFVVNPEFEVIETY